MVVLYDLIGSARERFSCNNSVNYQTEEQNGWREEWRGLEGLPVGRFCIVGRQKIQLNQK